ncbi:MAG: hypothetical protein WA987_00510 [Cellvibrio sp.]|jgi:hypothetical protein
MLMLKNPITAILRSQSPRGIKVIALSLFLVLACAAPMMLYVVFGPEDGNPVGLGFLFAGGALIAHVGFTIGLLLLIWDTFIKKK